MPPKPSTTASTQAAKAAPKTSVAAPTKVSPKPRASEPAPAAPTRAAAGSTTASKNARTFDFGDESVKGGFSDRPEAFKGKAGYTYIIRVVTTPVAYFGSFVENKSEPNKSFFMQSRADYDIAAEAYAGNAEAEQQAAEQCPLWERKMKIQQKFVCGIYVVAKEDKQGRRERVGQFYPWSFGGERYQSLTNLSRSLPSKADGSRTSIRAVEIRATCKDERFQKFDLMPVTTKADMQMSWAEVWEDVKQHFKGADHHSPCDKIEEFVAPDSKRDMIASLDRAAGVGENAVEEPDDAPPPRRAAAGKGSAPARRPAPPPPQDDAESALDACLEDVSSAEPEEPEEGEAPAGDELDDVD